MTTTITNENRTTYAIWIGDRSGSMLPLEDAHRKGYDDFVKEQKKEKGGAFFLTTITFDDKIDYIEDNTPIEKVKEATKTSFSARGSTALYDAIGEGIEHMMKIYNKNNESNKFCNYIIIIMTDGYENASVNYSKSKIKQMIEDCKMKDISVKFTGANQNAEQSGSQMGIDQTQCATFTPTPIGLTKLFRSVSETVKQHRLTGCSEFTPEVKLDLSLPKPPSFFDDININNNLSTPPKLRRLSNTF